MIYILSFSSLHLFSFLGFVARGFLKNGEAPTKTNKQTKNNNKNKIENRKSKKARKKMFLIQCNYKIQFSEGVFDQTK